MHIFQKWLFVPALFLGLLNPVLACMCTGDTNIKNYNLHAYEAIFLGELRGAKHFQKIPINERISFPAEVDTFYILKVWKGNIKQGQMVNIYQFGIGCDNSLMDSDSKSRVIIGATRKTQKQEGMEGMERFLIAGLCDPIIRMKEDSLDFYHALQVLDNQFNQVKVEKKALLGYRMFYAISIVILLIIIVLLYKRRPDIFV
jgi:hypothetical protein